ncbi:MAG: hypothetical protein MUF42_13990 [Cytophagaceae bacterium]|jgi:hypothetical protein|nr:hypothetical protein [Cytophagaceae bacterium]
MRAKVLLFVVLGLSTFLTSCVVKKVSNPVSAVTTQIMIDYDDLEYVTDVTGTSTQSYLLGVIPVGNRTNEYGALGNAIIASTRTDNVIRNRGVNQALYNALTSKPDIDYLMPVSYKVEKQISFLGRKETVTVRAKAFKIRPKK